MVAVIQTMYGLLCLNQNLCSRMFYNMLLSAINTDQASHELCGTSQFYSIVISVKFKFGKYIIGVATDQSPTADIDLYVHTV